MKTKSWNTLYWTIAVFFCGSMLLAGVIEVMQTEEGKEIMRHLGFPLHVLRVIGIAKILGSLALLQTKFHALREWAYSGFTINLIGAFAARVSADDSVGLIASPMIGLGLVLGFYCLWKKKSRRIGAVCPLRRSIRPTIQLAPRLLAALLLLNAPHKKPVVWLAEKA